MKRVVTIWFRFLKTDWFTRRQPALKEKSFVLAQPDHGRMVVTAANPLASAKGIFPGMVVADARALFHGLQVLDDQPGIEEKLLKNLSLWSIRYTPIVAADPPDGLILDASGCTHLWGGETPYIQDMTTRLKAFGYHVQAAISDTIGCSWAMSRYCKGNTIIKKGDHMNELLPMPSASLRFDIPTIERLHKLGLKHVKDFIGMPRQSLRRRFGEDFLKKLDQALGYEEEFILPIEEPEPFEERLPCLEPIITLTGIEIALQRLLQSMCNQLSQEQKGLRTAVFKGYMADGRIESIEVSTGHPSNNPEHLFKLFTLKFSFMNPEGGIEVFLLKAVKVEPINPVQEKLWNASESINNKDLCELLDRLTAKYGQGTVKRFIPDEHYWPERSFKATNEMDEALTREWNVKRPRPLHLLEHPEPVEVTAPIPDYPPMNFRHNGTLHKIINADGPERIEQEWWMNEGQHRDYYYVEDEEGNRYWIFRSGHYDADKNYGWFLHGYFA